MSETEKLSDTADLIAAAALQLAAERGWRSLSLGEIATEAGLTLPELARHYTYRPEILDGFERMIDRRMLAGAIAGDVNDKPRDRLFDIIMERFDALLPYREGLRRISRELPFDPASGLALAAALPRAVAWMYTGARISIEGPWMPVRMAALGSLYLSVFRVWLTDENQDLSKTMAALDRGLDRIKSMLGGDLGPSRPAEPTPTDGPPEAVEPEPKPRPRRPAKRSAQEDGPQSG